MDINKKETSLVRPSIDWEMLETDDPTLVIKHLPQSLTVQQRIELLKRLGAVNVKIPRSTAGSRNGLAFASFERHSHAEFLLRTLHQKKLLGRFLTVEWARGRKPEDGEDLADADDTISADNERTSYRQAAEVFRERQNAWAPHLDFTQPPPAHLRYTYPAPTTRVLKNISSVLQQVPRFYTQVLHLMNRMNLPCPFSEDFSLDDPRIGETLAQREDLSEEESELESDSEEAAVKEIIPSGIKRPAGQVRFRSKIPKLGPQPVPSSSAPGLLHQEAFDPPSSDLAKSQKKIELKLGNLLDSLLDEKARENLERIDEDNAETIEIVEKPIAEPAENSLTIEELQRNRISSRDYHLLPVFKNYQAGLPTNRLYIKNLGKGVDAVDLECIYRLFVDSPQDSKFEVKVMTSGRMKGQAFVTFTSSKEAKRALEETNGYILKYKPMFVQFARSTSD